MKGHVCRECGVFMPYWKGWGRVDLCSECEQKIMRKLRQMEDYEG